MLHNVAWNCPVVDGTIAARRSLIAASRATATFLTTVMPVAVSSRDPDPPVSFGDSPDDEAVPFEAVEEGHQGRLVDAQLGRDLQLGALRAVAADQGEHQPVP